MTIGEKILEIRKAKDLNQEELAEKVNVTRQTISNWETDNTVPDFYQAIELCKALGIDIHELADITGFVSYDEQITLSLDDVLSIMLGRIKNEISTLSFETWFKELKISKLNKERIVIEVPESIHRKILSKNDDYKKMIINIINDITKQNIHEVIFIEKKS